MKLMTDQGIGGFLVDAFQAPAKPPNVGPRIPEGFGYDLAEALGHEPMCDVGVGIDGRVYLLADDFAMKVTLSEVEAGLCRILLEAGEAGTRPECLFWVNDVFRTTLPDGGTAYVVIREDVEDVFPDPQAADRDHVREWGNTVSYLAAAWETDRPDRRYMARRWSPPDCRIDDVFEGLDWLREHAGVVVQDLGVDNLGRRPTGHICVRDLGRGAVHGNAVAEALSRIPDMPEPALRHGP